MTANEKIREKLDRKNRVTELRQRNEEQLRHSHQVMKSKSPARYHHH